jgi:hypothetical protein
MDCPITVILAIRRLQSKTIMAEEKVEWVYDCVSLFCHLTPPVTYACHVFGVRRDRRHVSEPHVRAKADSIY